MPVQRQFYRDIQKWINGGMKGHQIFQKDIGLCFTYRYWSRYTGNKLHDIRDDFKTAGLYQVSPFNENILDYNKERLAYSIYMNPRRLAWIKEHANPRPRITKSANPSRKNLD